VTKLSIRSLDSGQPYPDHMRRQKQERKDCINSTFYCVVSLAVFIAAYALSNPMVIEAIPGGAITSAIIGIGIFLTVIFLCIKQAPNRK